MSRRLNDEEREKLITENLGLVHYLVNKLNVPPGDYDDIVSIGTIGLIKAAQTFDPSKEIKFSTYSSRCINNEIFMHFRRDKDKEKLVFLEDTINEEHDGRKLTLGETIVSPDSYFTEEIVERDVLEKLINIILNLLEPRKRLIMLYKIAGMKQDFIAEALNISQSYISRLEKKLIEELKMYSTTVIEYDKIFFMSIVDNSYKISFYSNRVKNFNKIFSMFMQNLESVDKLPDFNLISSEGRIIIYLPSNLEAFYFIAKIIQAIDDYNTKFLANEESSSVKENETSDKVKLDEKMIQIPNTTEEVEKKKKVSKKSSKKLSKKERKKTEKASSIKPTKSQATQNASDIKKGDKQKQVKEYMLSLETFTAEDLKEHFPNVSISTIYKVIIDAKTKKLIAPIGGGRYSTKEGVLT